LVNGSTAIDGLSGISRFAGAAARGAAALSLNWARHARIGSAMFLSDCAPRSSQAT
jgi:hypothetical protein